MRNSTQVRNALHKVDNLAEFAKRHKLPIRTVRRVKAGGSARLGTLTLICNALDQETAK